MVRDLEKLCIYVFFKFTLKDHHHRMKNILYYVQTLCQLFGVFVIHYLVMSPQLSILISPQFLLILFVLIYERPQLLFNVSMSDKEQTVVLC